MSTPSNLFRPVAPPPILRSKGRILGVKLMPENEKWEWDAEGPSGQGGETKWYGLAPVMLIQNIVPKVQSTLFYGLTLYMLHNDAGIFNQQTGFIKYMDQFLNVSKTWAELEQVPIWPGLIRIATMPVEPQPTPVAMGKLVMLGAGYEPTKGYWVEFAGNFFLGFPLFQPADGTNWQIAYGGGPANVNPGQAALTANGFDVPVGDIDGSKKKC